MKEIFGVMIMFLLVCAGFAFLFWGIWTGMSWLDAQSTAREKADPYSLTNINNIAKQKCLDSGGIPHTLFWSNGEIECNYFTPPKI